jgi:enhancing lycopene biosynthesis protein 2
MKKRIGVVLAGCGVFDGAEIQEAVITLLALDEAGVEIVCLAPDVPQLHVINHKTGEVAEGETRNVLVESARIARGKITPIDQIDIDSLDAAVFPGGFGAAKNLCTFAVDGPAASINDDVKAFVQAMHAAGKPLGFACISPTVAAIALGKEGPELTIGNDADVAAGIGKLGAQHMERPVTEIHQDAARKIVSTPAYMYDARISEVAVGLRKMVAKVVELCDK